ncbi:Uncharacterised protein [Budvicia aquatica]|uniref:Uncharacterized protein n=1 Tax=Budvicia aquatica TaxID=82979 RepID=A0A484ZVY4_9GAMM|nr:Uncharacterised protein [Budvicia aquatica]
MPAIPISVRKLKEMLRLKYVLDLSHRPEPSDVSICCNPVYQSDCSAWYKTMVVTAIMG